MRGSPLRSGFLLRPNAQVYYEDSGEQPGAEKPVLLLIMGARLGLWAWESQMDLAADFRLILFDNRGSGLTRCEGQFSIEDLADDAAAVLDACNVEHAHVMGMSMGGFVAQAFYLRYPHRVDRIVFASTSVDQRHLKASYDEQVLARLKLEGEVLARSPANYSETLREPASLAIRFGAEYTSGEEHRAAADRWMSTYATRVLEDRRFAIFGGWQQSQAMAAFDCYRELAHGRIRVPAMLVRGSADELVPRENLEQLADLCEHPETVEMETRPGPSGEPALSAAHNFMWQCAVETNDLVRGFLAPDIR